MGAPNSEAGYTSATTRRGDHESLYGTVVAYIYIYIYIYIGRKEIVR
jgi:hypothetical protein